MAEKKTTWFERILGGLLTGMMVGIALLSYGPEDLSTAVMAGCVGVAVLVGAVLGHIAAELLGALL